MARRIVSVNETFDFPAEVRARLIELFAGTTGGPLALVAYDPDVQAEHPTPSSSFSSLSPANLSAIITAPASGGVIVDLEAHVNTCGGRGYWGVIVGSEVVSSGIVCGPVAENDAFRGRARLVVSGLTPGNSYTLAWASAATSGMVVRAGGSGGSLGPANSGPATMTVWSAP